MADRIAINDIDWSKRCRRGNNKTVPSSSHSLHMRPRPWPSFETVFGLFFFCRRSLNNIPDQTTILRHTHCWMSAKQGVMKFEIWCKNGNKMNQKTVVQTLTTTISSAAPGKSENTSTQQQHHTDGRWQYYFNDQSASKAFTAMTK